MGIRRALALVLALGMLWGALPLPALAGDREVFTDVRMDAYYFVPMLTAQDLGIIHGYGDRTARPQGEITRAEYAQVLFRMGACLEDQGISLPEPRREVTALPEDVAETAWYSRPVRWALGRDALLTDGENRFHPREKVTRRDMVEALYRLSGAPAPGEDLARFTDTGDLTEPAVRAFAWAVEQGVIYGTTDTTLSPGERTCRCQVVAMLFRYMTKAAGATVPEVSPETRQAYADYAAEQERLRQEAMRQRIRQEREARARREKYFSPTAAAVTRSDDAHRTMQQRIGQLSQEYGAVGVSAAYIAGGVVEDTFAWGQAVKGKTPMTGDSILRVASISKIIVALGAMLQAENGKLDLDGDLGDYLGFRLYRRAAGDRVTARSILNHNASLANLTGEGGSYTRIRQLLTDGTGIRNFPSGDPANYSYNDFAFYVLGLAVERAGGDTMDALLRDPVYDALHLDAAFWAGDVADTGKLAAAYRATGELGLDPEKQRKKHAPAYGTDGAVFAGNFYASAFSVGKVIAMLAADGEYCGERIIPAWIPEEMEKLSGTGKAKGEYFTQATPLEFQQNLYGQQRLYYHTGNAYGVHALACYNPDTGRGAVILTTGTDHAVDSRGIYTLCGRIAQALLQDYR